MPGPDLSRAHVANVKCPQCGIIWTGIFFDPPSEALCKHCVADIGKSARVDHKDLVINPDQVR